jgi:dTDP-4-amino-4,6-dideoxygalactose transaminase
VAEQSHRGLAGLDGLEVRTTTSSGGVDQYFVVQIDEQVFGISRDEIFACLRSYNVFARRYFHPMVSALPPYCALPSADAAALPEAHRAAEECLALPFYGALTPLQVEHVCAILHWIAADVRRTRREA